MNKNSNFLQIGYGAFGTIIPQYLFPNQPITIYSRTPQSSNVNTQVTFTNNLAEAVQKANVILLAIPVNQLDKVILDIKPYLKAGTIILDFSTVKLYPASLMQTYLPAKINVIATHPMFGPSIIGKNHSIQNLAIVMWNVRSKKMIYESMKNHFQSIGLSVVEMEPAMHDRIQAETQFVIQLQKFMLQNTQLLKTSSIDTPSVRVFREALALVNVTEQAFIDMIRYNIHCQFVLKAMNKYIQKLMKIYQP